MAPLAIELRAPSSVVAGSAAALDATYVNTGAAPLALAFWWCRNLRVVDVNGAVVAPGPGPVLPCGAAEDWHVLAPGDRYERREPLACTQPAGRSEVIGWTYALAPGTYRVALVFASPPAHGFTQSKPDERAFAGSVTSNEVTLVVTPTPRGLFARVFGR